MGRSNFFLLLRLRVNHLHSTELLSFCITELQHYGEFPYVSWLTASISNNESHSISNKTLNKKSRDICLLLYKNVKNLPKVETFDYFCIKMSRIYPKASILPCCSIHFWFLSIPSLTCKLSTFKSPILKKTRKVTYIT